MIRLLSYESLELPIGKGCLYTVGLKLGGLTGYAHARLGPDGAFSVPSGVSRETAELSRWYSQELVQFLVSLKGPRAATIVQHISEALTAAVAERDRRVKRARPVVDSFPKPEPSRTAAKGRSSDWWGDPVPRRARPPWWNATVDVDELDPDDPSTRR